jgi:hypothetical protein
MDCKVLRWSEARSMQTHMRGMSVLDMVHRANFLKPRREGRWVGR